jgi:hypothetical protein
MASKWKAGDLLNYVSDEYRKAIYLIVSIGDAGDTVPILVHNSRHSDQEGPHYWLGRVQEDRWHETSERVTLIGNIFERNA